jgi:thiol-disulfide isomerase/thioredoxin
MLHHDVPPLAPRCLRHDWRRLTVFVVWMPLAVLVVALAAGIASKQLEAQRVPSIASSLRWVFLTHPTCPECAELEAATRRTPAIEVLDWSNSADRASYRRLTRQRVVREDERVTLPMLVVVASNGTTLQWVGAVLTREPVAAAGRPTDPDAVARARREAQAFVGKPSTSFLVIRGQPVTAGSTVMVLGAPGCPPCEAAFDHLSGVVETPVIFVRPADDSRDISGLWPFPAKTPRSEYRCTRSIHTAPITLVTDSNGKVVWTPPFWPTGEDDVDVCICERTYEPSRHRRREVIGIRLWISLACIALAVCHANPW